MRIFNLILLYFLLLVSPWFSARSADIRASLITCYPGPEVYELYGHEAIRIHGIDDNGLPFDSVWNYGVFDFTRPNFVYRFVKGETDYMLAGYPFVWFMEDYRRRGSKVVEQDLNFDEESTRRLRKLLQEESLPQNCTYRYNYILDNCATRVADRVSEAAGDSIIYKTTPRFTSFRNGMRYYNRNYPWYQFGIDLVLGPGLDAGNYSVQKELYLPLELKRIMAQSTFYDGSPVVSPERILSEGKGDMTLPPTPFWLSPLAATLLILIVSISIVLISFRLKKIIKWWWAIFYTLLGLPGCLIFFLYFFSVHTATSPNLMIIWLNPLQLLVPVLIWSYRTRPAVTVLMWVNIIAIISLLVSWPLQSQSANIAIFPLMVSDLILAVTYAIFSLNKSYNINTPEPSKGNKRGISKKTKSTKKISSSRSKNK